MRTLVRSNRFAGAARALGVTLGSALAVVLVSFTFVSSARASSVFAVGGLGEPSLDESARLRALGGAGAAEFGPTAYSMINPASIAEARFLSLEATMLSTRRSISTTSFGSETAYETAFPSVRLVVHLPGRLVLGGSYLEGTNAGFEIFRPESLGTPSLLHITGAGGLNYVRVTLARRMSSRLRVGTDFEVIGGSYREEWVRTFQTPLLLAARDTLETSWDRLGRWRFGLQYGGERFSIGGAYETGRRVPATFVQRTAGSEVRTRGDFTIPEGYVAGFNLGLGARSRVVGQYRRQNWNDESLKSDFVDFRAEERFSLGFEKQPLGFGSTLHKLPLRIGATYLCWPDLLPFGGNPDVTNGVAHLDEWAVSIGTGIRTPDRGGTVDASFEGGSRGDEATLGARETFFRLAISVKVSDSTWK
ncbi:MAG: hypothetical protein ACRENN_01705 [Candidatus Eiseniibacteriota bacterium]